MQVLGLVAAERGQAAGQHQGLAGQGLGGLVGGSTIRFFPMDTGGTQLIHHLAVVGLVEKGADALRDDGADVAHLQQLLDTGVHDAIQ